MALVGALNVSRILLASKSVFNRGDELGYFDLGSTIVMLVEAKGLKELMVKEGEHVQYGQPIFEYTE
jgi:phosphatidylserine decarboxylase